MNIPIVLYTHDSYSDVFEICLNQLKKYNLNNIICLCNKKISNVDTILYEDNSSYTERIYKNINELPERFLFMHEDFILYDQPKMDLLDEYFSIKDSNIKLIKSGVKDSVKIYNTLYRNNGPFYFSIQASILNKNFFSTLLNENLKKNIWQFEVDCQDLASKFINLFHYDNEKKRGLDHYDSNVFPYMATAINKGKWNSEYFTEFNYLGVDISKRGII